jgi:hypothetical protein
MVMSEMGLSRIEELPHTITLELRPTLATGDPAVLLVERIHHALVSCDYSGCPIRGPFSVPRVVNHAPETCHCGVGVTFPERCQPFSGGGPESLTS